jgi:hypothetical protein
MLKIDGYIIDASVVEEHSFDADVTEHPVESGANIADHVRSKPARVTIDGVVSDTPIGNVADLRIADDPGALPSNDAFTRLLLIRQLREPVTIETDIRTYDNMVLQSLSVPRSKETGEALMFRATFVEVIIITNERTSVRVAVPRAKNKTNLGEKPSTTEKPPAKAQQEAGDFWSKSWIRKGAKEFGLVK